MAAQTYFPDLFIAGQRIDLSHLEPFDFDIDSRMAKKILKVHVTFSTHCFSRKFRAETHPSGEPMIDHDSPRPRTFCPIRYRLSKQLPALILKLNHPKCSVTQTASRRNWVYSIKIEEPDGSYYVFFEISKAIQVGRQQQDLTLFVESAYPIEPDDAAPVLLGDMAFLVLCAKTYMRQPVATRR